MKGTSSLPDSNPWSAGNPLVRTATFRQHTAVGGVHTFNIVRDPYRDRFFGYAGPLTDGPLDLWISSNLQDWTSAPQNPILNQPGLRWPSAYCEKGRFYLATRGEYFSNRSVGDAVGIHFNRQISRWSALFVADRIRRRLTTPRPTSISLYRSDDGVTFEIEGTLIEAYSHNNLFNQNPFIFPNPPSGGVGLVYYSGDNEETFEVRCRVAETVPKLHGAASRRLIETEHLLAAPTIFYHPTRDTYWLLAEAKADERGSRDWIVEAYENDGLDNGFENATRHVVFEDDVACPFPYVYDGHLHLFVSKRLGGRLLPRWEGRLYTTSL